MRMPAYQWIKTNSSMLINTVSLAGTTAVTAVLGFAYWWLAARLFPPEAVGVASAATSIMTLLGTLSILGLGTLLIGELPLHQGDEGHLISAALILVGCTGGIVGVGFAVTAPLISKDFNMLRENIAITGLFATGVGLASITLVLDQALIGLLRGDLQFWRNSVFAVVKLGALFVASFWLRTEGISIYATWVFGNFLSLIVLAGSALWGRKWSVRNSLPHWRLLRKLGSSALQHHLLNLILQTPTLILPALVTVILSARENAWFYVSWMVASCASLIPYALTMVLYALTAAKPAEIARELRLTLSIALLACLFVNCLLQFGASQILAVFGPTYAEQATWCLRILGLGAFPLIIKDHYIALIRIQSRLIQAVIPLGAGVLLELGAAIVGAHFGGLSGLSVGWVTAFCIEGAYMFRTVYKTALPAPKTRAADPIQPYALCLDSTGTTRQASEPGSGQ